mgnify:CR=1 FL=1
MNYVEQEFDGFLGISLIPKETGFRNVIHIPFNDGVNTIPYVLYQRDRMIPISISDSPSFLMEGDNIEEFEEISVFIQKNKDLFLEHWYHCVDLVKFCDTVKGLKQ